MSDYQPGSSNTPYAPYPSAESQPTYQQPQQYPVQPQQYTMPPQAPLPIQGQIAPQYAPQYAEQKSKVAAALFAFFLGGLGVHGFYLGNTAMGITLLVVSLVSVPLMLIGVGFLSWFAIGIICLIQTILYVAAPDHEFHNKYVVQKRWF